jgi:hypothetical protein
MWALLQALAIAFVAAVVFVVEKLEPNRLYAYLFMFLIIAVGTMAIVDQLLPKADDRYLPIRLHRIWQTQCAW